MAARFFIGTGNWTTGGTTVWSATSGGSTGASVPTALDDVTFDTHSGNVTIINNTVNCRSFTATNYTGTFTFSTANAVLNIFGNVTLGSAMTIVPSGTFSVFNGISQINITANNTNSPANTLTITSNGKHFPTTVTLYNNVGTVSPDMIITFADDAHFDGMLTTKTDAGLNGGQSNTMILNGHNIFLNSDFFAFGFNSYSANHSGTTVWNFTGTAATITDRGAGGNLSMTNPIVINTTGSISFSSTGFYVLSLGNFTNTAGTINFVNTYLTYFADPSGTTTLSLNGIFWPGETSLSNGIYVLNSLYTGESINVGTSEFVPDVYIQGTAGFTVNSLFLFADTHFHLTSGLTYTVNNVFEFDGYYGTNTITGTGGNLMDASTPGTVAYLNITNAVTLMDVYYTNFTDIDCSGGVPVWVFDTVLSNTSNIKEIPLTQTQVAKTFVN